MTRLYFGMSGLGITRGREIANIFWAVKHLYLPRVLKTDNVETK